MRLALLVLVACHAPVRSTGVDWTTPPLAVPPPTFAAPRADAIELPNGLHVIVVENHRLPVVAITAIHGDAGARADRGMPGLAALTADLLDEGAGSRGAAELAEALERAGARLEIFTAADYATMQLVTTADHTGESLALLADMIRRPRFADGDVERVRQRRAAEIEQHATRARTMAGQLFDRVIFDAHPYAFPAEGTVAGLARVGAPQVRELWSRSYGPEAMTLVVAGDVQEGALRATVEHLFGDWRARRGAASPPPHRAIEPRLAYIDLPGATETVLLMGREIAIGEPQRLAADVANAIVGGGAGSRLDRELHELGALAPSTSFWRGALAGTWTVAVTIATDKTDAAIRASLATIAASKDIRADELARAKTTLLRSTTQAFDTMSGTARAFERLVVLGLPLTYYTGFADRLAALRTADLRAVTDAWTGLSIVVVGDWARLAPSLGKLGLPIVRYDRDGNRAK